LFGAPGVGAPLATCVATACARTNAALSVIPLPEICAPAAWVRVSGAATVIVAPPLPPVVATIRAVSSFGPLSMVTVWPAVKPMPPATGINEVPAVVAAVVVVAPAVPTEAIVAVSAFAPPSIVTVWPGAKSVTAATLILVAPASDAAASVVAGWSLKSLQLLSVSAPSGKRPALR
jgi:hypothetical protein